MEPYDLSVFFPDGTSESVPVDLSERFERRGRAWRVELRNCRYWAVPLSDESAPSPLPWIRCDERLPEDDRAVLCKLRHDDRPTFACHDEFGGWTELTRGDGWGWVRGRWTIEPTHWLPLTPPA